MAKKDLKGLYQDKAEELVGEDYYELPSEEQLTLYKRAMMLVHEELQGRAETLWAESCIQRGG